MEISFDKNEIQLSICFFNDLMVPAPDPPFSLVGFPDEHLMRYVTYISLVNDNPASLNNFLMNLSRSSLMIVPPFLAVLRDSG